MRFTRLLAFATWVVIALLAMAAFAAFSPSSELGDAAVPTSAPSAIEDEAAGTLPPDIGAAAGRQAAFGFSQDMLSLAVPDTTTTTVALTTTTIPPTTTTTSTSSTTTTTTIRPTPTTTAPPPRTFAPMPAESVYSLVSAYFQPGDVERAVLIAWCESRYDPGATNPSSGAAGLFQHIPRYWSARSAAAGVPGTDIHDPAANTAVAAWLVYSNGGWKHWNASIGCWGNGSVVPPSTTTTTVVADTTTTVPTSTTTSTAPLASTTTTAPATTTSTTAP